MSGRGSGFFGPGSEVLDFRSCLSLSSWVLGPGSWIPDPRSWVHSVVITKCEKKLLQSMAVITKCDRKLLQRAQELQIVKENY